MDDVLVWVGVGALGGLAALARFLVDGFVAARAATGFPIGTFAVNLSGVTILGLLTGLALSGDQMLLVGTAVIGSYTTFSTWMLETHRLAELDQRALAVANIVLSVTLGVLAAALGRAIA